MFTKIKSKLQAFTQIFSNTQRTILEKISRFGCDSLSSDSIEDLERILFEADLGAETVQIFLRRFQSKHNGIRNIKGEKVLRELRLFTEELLQPMKNQSVVIPGHPHVIMMVGMNGSGKTTSCAKLAHYFAQINKRVLLVAADTFRAAAVSQLSVWADRLQIPIVKGRMGGDPAAVLHDALTSAKTRNFDIVIVDTAGRMESKKHVMNELIKMRKVSANVIDGAPHENILILDASMGQHAIEHAKAFHAVSKLTGLIVTKIEGSAKGGIILHIYRQMHIPVQYLGIGERVEDFIEFDPANYINALFPSQQFR